MVSRLLAQLRRRASFANVVSLLALFVALGGGAYAAVNYPPHSIPESALQTDSVTARVLAQNAVSTKELQKDAVRREDLANGAVSRAELAKQAVGLQQLAAGAVGVQQLKKGAVGLEQLRKGAVGPDQLRTASVGPEKIKDRTLTPQEFKVNGLPEVGYASRELGTNPLQPPYGPPESLTIYATNAGVLNLDVVPPTSGYTTSSGVVGAVAPSRLIANAQVVLHGDAQGEGHCRLAVFHAGQTDQLPFAAGTNATVDSGKNVALPLAGGVDVEPGSYNVRVQCYADAANTTSFVRGSLTVSIAPR